METMGPQTDKEWTLSATLEGATAKCRMRLHVSVLVQIFNSPTHTEDEL